MKAAGWLLDVYTDGERAVLWFKLEDGRALRLHDGYVPDFYVEPKETFGIEGLAALLYTHPNILKVAEEEKYASVNHREKSKVLRVYVDEGKNFSKVLKDLERGGFIEAYYNVDILHVQRYLFQRGIEPTGKFLIEWEEKGRLLRLKALREDEDIRPPPFTTLTFDTMILSPQLSPTVERDPIGKIRMLDAEMKPERVFEGEEEDILHSFSSCVRTADPDILVSHLEALTYLLKRAKLLGLNLQLGREEADLRKMGRLVPYAFRGRIHLPMHTFLSYGVAGLSERSKFTLIPPGLCADWQAGRTIDSRQCFEALRRGILIPKRRSFGKYPVTAWDLLYRDRGGLVLSPKVGLHENVAELDYESMFPNIIIHENISYETVTPYYVDKSRSGFLGEFTERFLKRRIHFKHLRKSFPRNNQEWLWCEQRQLALKMVLVCIYGFSGCFANRFNNVAAYEEINREARKKLVETQNIARRESFEVVYIHTDSIFLKRKDATRRDYKELAETIQTEIGLPISLDHHYKFLVFLNQRTVPDWAAASRYFGKLTNGEFHYRGIPLRRHDCPPFLKDFQLKLMEILFNADSANEVEEKQLKKAWKYVDETCDKVLEGNFEPEELVVSKVLRKPLREYTNKAAHVTAAEQMVQKGKRLETGDLIDFVYVNSEHSNPSRRVVPAVFLQDGHRYYDRKKYVRLVLDAAHLLLDVFGSSNCLFKFTIPRGLKDFTLFHQFST